MTEAIERAARAYCEAAYGPGMADLYQKMNDIRWQEAIASVPAVLESLLPPSEEMAGAMLAARSACVLAAKRESREYPTSLELNAAQFTAAILCVLGRAE